MTGALTTRIHARLPADVARKLAWLERRTRKTTTEVLRASIERYFAAELDRALPMDLADASLVVGEEGAGSAERILAESGFIGAADGPADLSSTYEAELARSLEKKG
jgi:predicted DNA-binding protein